MNLKKSFFIFILFFTIQFSFAFDYEGELNLEGEREVYQEGYLNNQTYHILAFCSSETSCEEWIIIKEKDFTFLGPPIKILNSTDIEYYEILRQLAFRSYLPNQDYFYSSLLIETLGLNNNLCNWIDEDKILGDTSLLETEKIAEGVAPKSCVNGKTDCKKIIRTVSKIGNTAFKIEKATSPMIIFSVYCKGNTVYFIEPSLDYALELDTIVNNINTNNFYYGQIEDLINSKTELNEILNPTYKEGEGILSNLWVTIKKSFSFLSSTYNYGLNFLEWEEYRKTREAALEKFKGTATKEQLEEANSIAVKHLNDSNSRLEKLYLRNSETKKNVLLRIENFSEKTNIQLKLFFYNNVSDLENFESAKKEFEKGIKLERDYKFNSALEKFNSASIHLDKAYQLNNEITKRDFSSRGKLIIILVAVLIAFLSFVYLRK